MPRVFSYKEWQSPKAHSTVRYRTTLEQLGFYEHARSEHHSGTGRSAEEKEGEEVLAAAGNGDKDSLLYMKNLPLEASFLRILEVLNDGNTPRTRKSVTLGASEVGEEKEAGNGVLAAAGKDSDDSEQSARSL